MEFGFSRWGSSYLWTNASQAGNLNFCGTLSRANFGLAESMR